MQEGYEVVGIDNLSKYGKIIRNHSDINYDLHLGDVKDADLFFKLLKDCDYLIAGAAMIGGISYFHDFAYDLLSENEKIISSTADTAIECQNNHKLKELFFLSSSMVFESTDIFPTKEDLFKNTTKHGFQNLQLNILLGLQICNMD